MRQDAITWMIQNKETFEADRFFVETGIESRDIEVNFEKYNLATDPEILAINEDYVRKEKDVQEQHKLNLIKEKNGLEQRAQQLNEQAKIDEMAMSYVYGVPYKGEANKNGAEQAEGEKKAEEKVEKKEEWRAAESTAKVQWKIPRTKNIRMDDANFYNAIINIRRRDENLRQTDEKLVDKEFMFLFKVKKSVGSSCIAHATLKF